MTGGSDEARGGLARNTRLRPFLRAAVEYGLQTGLGHLVKQFSCLSRSAAFEDGNHLEKGKILLVNLQRASGCSVPTQGSARAGRQAKRGT